MVAILDFVTIKEKEQKFPNLCKNEQFWILPKSAMKLKQKKMSRNCYIFMKVCFRTLNYLRKKKFGCDLEK